MPGVSRPIILYPSLLPYPPFPVPQPAAPPSPAAGGAAVTFAPQALTTARTYTVVFTPDQLPASAETLVRDAGGQITYAVPAIGVLTATSPDPDFLARLRARGDLAAAGPVCILRLRDPKAGPVQLAGELATAATAEAADLYRRFQWDIRKVTGDGRSWELETGNHQVVVGLIDTGIDTGHPDLHRNLLGTRQFVPGATDARDEHGHGTHMAGAIAGNGRVLGVGPNLGLRAYRAFTASGETLAAWLAAAMVAAADDGVDVIALGLGGFDAASRYYISTRETSDVADFMAYHRAVKYALERNAAIVTAAGNDALDLGSARRVTDFLNAEYGPCGYVFRSPARQVSGSRAGVLTVGATAPDDRIAVYTNYGAGNIDITGPGGDFLRGTEAGWWTDLCLSTWPGGYAWMAGTGMAAAKVAATVALTITDGLRRTGRKPFPAQATAQVLQAAAGLVQAEPLPGRLGRGAVDALAALGGH